MEKYKPCLDLALPKVEELKLDPFPLLSPTLHYSNTPALLVYDLIFFTIIARSLLAIPILIIKLNT
jgi:hypothetical protein